jgi:hypothetical protein
MKRQRWRERIDGACKYEQKKIRDFVEKAT